MDAAYWRLQEQPSALIGRYAALDVINEKTGEIYVEAGQEITEAVLELFNENDIDLLPTLAIDHVNVGAYIRNTLLADKNLQFELQSDEVLLAAHPWMLRELVRNLLHNAIRHGGAGCHVTLAVATDGRHVRFSVVDDGPGLPPEELARAGERFFRGRHGQLPGSGLGLAIARTVAQRHGGEMRVSVGPEGRGLAVTMELAGTGAPSFHAGKP